MTSDTERELPFVQKVFVVVGIVILTILLVTLLYFTLDVLLLIFSAVLIAIFLRGLAVPLAEKLNIREVWAVLAVSLVLILVLAGGIALLAPSVAEQARHLRQELPRSGQQVADFVSRYEWGQALIMQLPSTQDVMARVDAASLLSGVGGVFSSTVGAVGNFFIVILLAVYLAAEPTLYTRGFTKLFPIGRREGVTEVIDTTGETLRWWLVGKIGSMIFIGVLTWIGLSIIGVPLALTLGLIAGLLSFIPNFGPIISAIPALLLAFIDSPVSALYVLGLYVGVQLIESNLVTPYIERMTVELPPALTIIFQIVFAITLGGLGLVLATPLLAMLMVVIQLVYVRDVLGDRDIDTGPGTEQNADGPTEREEDLGQQPADVNL
jgi:predicted PurR-regulated permease PerM